MKKHYLILLIALMTSLATVGQCRLDAYNQNVLAHHKAASTGAIRLKNKVTETDKALAIIKIDEDADSEELQRKGVEIIRQRDGLAVVSLPVDSVMSITQTAGLSGFSFPRSVSARLDKAHPTTGVDMVQAGTDLPQDYDGSGVVVGVVDIGFDPNHIAFYNKTATENRVKRLFVVSGANGRETVKTYDTAAAIAKYTTDEKTESHGTHVAGIAVGGYSDETIKFIGVAPGADITLAPLKSTTDAAIILGIESIIDYAKAQGKPVVINMSLGANIGPHDGSTLSDEYLSKLGAQVPICISAGNEGDLAIVAKKAFTASDDTLQVLSESCNFDGDQYGTVEFWSNSDKPFSIKPVVYNINTEKVVHEFDAIATATKSLDLKQAAYFTGHIVAYSEVDQRNKRYNALFDFNISKIDDDNYAVGFIITGEDGQSIEAYADGYDSQFIRNESGWKEALTTNGTINSMACAGNLITVGVYSSRDREQRLDGSSESVRGKINDIAEWSSYGTLFDGRNLPHVCAPGHSLISSYSTPYIKTQTLNVANFKAVVAKVKANNRYHFWDSMSGTSMSSPYVAGVVALWLQANPMLKYNDIVEVINASSIKDDFVAAGNAVQWGAGKINAYNGLKKILTDKNQGGVMRLTAAEGLLVKTMGVRTYEVFVPAAEQFTLTVSDITGKVVESRRVDGNTATLNMSGRHGIYIVNVKGYNINATQKIAVK